jgi:hypothetical protein
MRPPQHERAAKELKANIDTKIPPGFVIPAICGA